MRLISVALALLLLVAGLPGLAATSSEPSYAISMYGDLKYGPGFRHFEYVNPRAPKGGDVKLAVTGTFDNLNPFILKGVPAAGSALIFDTLLTPSGDEAFSEYGLLAETVETPPDRAWVAFTLRSQARFHDGSPITVEDVIWTFDTLKSKGHPQYRAYYSHVVSAEKVGPRTVRFAFKGGVNRELPLIVGQLPVLSKAYWSTRDFTRTTLESPLGSGPYKVDSFEQGRAITYRRVKDYWGASLPVNVGRNNFETLRYDYYRDLSVLLEAFKGGAFDYRQENSAKNWATGYDSPALREGRIKKEQIPNQIPAGMQGFTFNTRRAIFADRRVRAALSSAFDFEWTNAHLFYGAYKRSESYFANSELAARGLPGADELAVLEPFRGKVPEEVFTREYHAPVTGPGGVRSNMVEALRLLEEAGWVVRDMRLVNVRTGQPMTFEILIGQGEQWERISLPFVKNLEKLGVTARVRPVDAAQYEYRTKQFDYDMTVSLWPQSVSPGNEQIDFWTSEKANEPGSQNYAGIRDPVVDALVGELIAAPTRAALIARCRALDRVLQWGYYVIPHWHLGAYRVAYWDKFGRPPISPKYSVGLDTWWVKP